MPEVFVRRFLREKEAAQLIDEFSRRLKADIRGFLDVKKPNLEVTETPSFKIYFVSGKPLFAQLKDTLVPTLLFDKAFAFLPKITVNMGAVPHICNGADVLAPGVVRIDGTFKKDDYVLVVDERHQKPLAVAIALTEAQAARSLQHGKVAKNVHYVGDVLWNQLKKTQ
jgi:PUA-domain protein